MTTTPANIHAALVEAHKELTNPHKNSTANTGQYGYSYIDLAGVVSHVRPVLSKHGLAVSQDIAVTADGRLGISTTLHHTSGETLTFGPVAGPNGSTWQQLGSGITYARRYGLLAALGLAADEDDDGASAGTEQPKRKPEPPRAVATDEDIVRWHAAIVTAPDRIHLKAVGDEINGHHLDDEVRAELLATYRARWSEVE